MRQRTKMSGLVSHTSPNGKSCVSHKEHCINKLHKLEKMLDEGWKIIHSEVKKSATPKEVVVNIFGGKVKMTFAEYKQHGDGLKVIMEIF